jgi:hypothetical protein
MDQRSPSVPAPTFLRLSEKDQVNLLGLMPDEVLRRIEAAYAPQDCDCPIEDGLCGCDEFPDCDCPAVPLPCEHVLAAAGRPFLAPLALAYLLWRLHPDEYAEPPPPATPSANTNKQAQVAVYGDRADQVPRVGLRHPADWLRLGPDGVDPRLAREPIRLRNGADAIGPLRLLPPATAPVPTEEGRQCA